MVKLKKSLYEEIGECRHKGRNILVLRDKDGKFYIKVNGITTQKRLTASEITRWFLNAMHEVISDKYRG